MHRYVLFLSETIRATSEREKKMYAGAQSLVGYDDRAKENNIHRQAQGTAAGVAVSYIKLPRIWIKGGYFYCDGEGMHFQRASRRLSLLKAFLSVRGYRLGRKQIMALVYDENRLHLRSQRYTECLNMSMLRMLSDTRRQLCTAFAPRYPGIDWLHFNKGERRWKLLRFRDDYVLAHLHASVS